MKVLSDAPAERAVLAGICRYGSDSYLDVVDILSSTTFTIAENQAIYDCVHHVLEQNDGATIDVPIIQSAAIELGIGHLFETRQQAQHLQAIFNFPVSQKNVRRFAAKIRKLEIARLLGTQLDDAKGKLTNLSGDETVTHILGIAEDAIFDFTSLLHDSQDNEPTLLGDGLLEYITYLGENPVDSIGIATGFPEYDSAIGGGLRPGTVNVIAARPKTGKTLLSDNMGYYIADTTGIPVFNMDTEMRKEDHQHRTLAMITDCYIYDIETGQYALKPDTKEKVLSAAKKIEQEKVPYYHLSIAGMPFEEQVAIMRRWLVKNVGLDDDGKAKPCVIVYDYLKLMTQEGISNDMKEYQLLGFLMTSLHNFAMRYQLPFLTFMQTNRDGINKESTDTASGSDRIIWLCSNFTIFKRKSDEEIAEDGQDAGNRKLVPVVSRHGADFQSGDYINCHMVGECAKITEGQRKVVWMIEQAKEKTGFPTTQDNEGNDIPFQ